MAALRAARRGEPGRERARPGAPPVSVRADGPAVRPGPVRLQRRGTRGVRQGSGVGSGARGAAAPGRRHLPDQAEARVDRARVGSRATGGGLVGDDGPRGREELRGGGQPSAGGAHHERFSRRGDGDLRRGDAGRRGPVSVGPRDPVPDRAAVRPEDALDPRRPPHRCQAGAGAQARVQPVPAGRARGVADGSGHHEAARDLRRRAGAAQLRRGPGALEARARRGAEGVRR